MQELGPISKSLVQFAESIGPQSRLRIAPTPSGYLHIGNAYNFILNWLLARLYPGTRLFLRIDDLDAARKRPEYVLDIFETLNWLGLDWDEGPRSVDDFEKNWSQHNRIAQYEQILGSLKNRGSLFACQKSRRELAPFQGKYPLEFRLQNLQLDDPDVAWRIKTPSAPKHPIPADFIVRRRDGLPAYQVASLSDDLKFGITHIIRGEDLASSTAAQQFLSNCLENPSFAEVNFFHHPLILDQLGSKISKSEGATAIRTMRADGQSPERLFRSLAEWLGLPINSINSANELLVFFQKIRIKKS